MTDPLPLLAHANRALARAWESGRWRPPSLDPNEIERYAARKEGVDRVPGTHWREAFEVLLADLREHAQLSPLGRLMANGQLVRLLRARVRAERLLRRHPEILEQPIEAPLIIMGQMRSGTTRLHRLLACDPRFVATRLFETLEPVPYRRGIDRRLPQAAALLAFLHRANPALKVIHPTSPLAVEEEFGHLSFSLHGAQLEAQWNVPRFAAFAEERDTRQVYRELRTLLQLNGWAKRASPKRSWLIKCPQFTADICSLIEAFPRARVILLNRDVPQVVASSASLVWQQRRLHSEVVDRDAIGRDWLRKTMLRQQRTTDFRQNRPDVELMDISFDQVSRDWRGAVERIYHFVGWPLTRKVASRMERFLGSARQHQGHHYSLEQFGLSRRDLTDCRLVRGGAASTSDVLEREPVA